MRFGLDAASFSVLYSVLYLSIHAAAVHGALWVVAGISAWHFLVWSWHLASKCEGYTTTPSVHFIRAVAYVFVWIIGVETQRRDVLVVLTTLLILWFNGSRLYYFLQPSSEGAIPVAPKAPTLTTNVDRAVTILLGICCLVALVFGVVSPRCRG